MEEHLESTARAIIAHFGSQAVEVAATRARDLARCGDWRGQDMALMVLNQVERLSERRLGSKPN